MSNKLVGCGIDNAGFAEQLVSLEFFVEVLVEILSKLLGLAFSGPATGNRPMVNSTKISDSK